MLNRDDKNEPNGHEKEIVRRSTSQRWYEEASVLAQSHKNGLDDFQLSLGNGAAEKQNHFKKNVYVSVPAVIHWRWYPTWQRQLQQRTADEEL